MYDFHTHSNFSDDSSTPISSIIDGAIKKSLKGVCITDHVDIDYPNTTINFDLDYNGYKKEINRLQALYNNKIHIYAGLEFGLKSDILQKANNFMNDKSFDFIIGSIHALKDKELYMGQFLENLSINQGIINYFEEMLECINQFDNFDVIGHFDVIRRYIPSSDENFKFEKYKDYIIECLKAIIKKGKGIEINTSTYGLADFHPIPQILKMYKTLGGEIITLGSDSHNSSTLGRSFDKALNHLQDIGFKYYTIFSNRQKEFIKI